LHKINNVQTPQGREIDGPCPESLRQKAFASSLPSMGSHDVPLLGELCLPNSSCFFVRLTTRRFFVPA
jgi:hypothetical protein